MVCHVTLLQRGTCEVLQKRINRGVQKNTNITDLIHTLKSVNKCVAKYCLELVRINVVPIH